jgi:hypothetical protein
MGKENPGFIQSGVQLESRMHPETIQRLICGKLAFRPSPSREHLDHRAVFLDEIWIQLESIYIFKNGLFYMHWARTCIGPDPAANIWITELCSWMKSGYNLNTFISLKMAYFTCIGPERGTFGA